MTTEPTRQQSQPSTQRIKQSRTAAAVLTFALVLSAAGTEAASALSTSSNDVPESGTGLNPLLLVFGTLAVVALIVGPRALRMVRSTLFPGDPHTAAPDSDPAPDTTSASDEALSSPNERPADDQ